MLYISLLAFSAHQRRSWQSMSGRALIQLKLPCLSHTGRMSQGGSPYGMPPAAGAPYATVNNGPVAKQPTQVPSKLQAELLHVP